MLRKYQGLIALKNAVREFPAAGGTYTKPKIDRNSIMDAEYVLVPGMEVDECIAEKGGAIPVQIAGKGYHEWLEAAMVREIIRNKRCD